MSAIIRLYVPRDTTACSLGADSVAATLQQAIERQQLPLDIVRNGSRGLYWLEPLIEMDTCNGLIAFGPVISDKVDEFIASRFWERSAEHPLYLGSTEDIPYLKKQQRVTFARVGLTNPLSIEDYCANSGFE